MFILQGSYPLKNSKKGFKYQKKVEKRKWRDQNLANLFLTYSDGKQP